MNFRIQYLLIFFFFAQLTFVSCSEENDFINSDENYGYVQFRLYKEASYQASTKAIVDELDYLHSAKKMKVVLSYDNSNISLSLPLSAYDAVNAEYGLRSEKVSLFAGDYEVKTITLYDNIDQELYVKSFTNEKLTAGKGGLVLKDLTVDVEERGKVQFSFHRNEHSLVTRTNAPVYLSSMSTATIRLRNAANQRVEFKDIKLKYETIIADVDGVAYQTERLVTDTLYTVDAGDWTLDFCDFQDRSDKHYTVEYDKNAVITISDNVHTNAQIMISVNEDEAHIKDYKALKAIWEALDGENWSFYGQGYNYGTNWNFDKDVEMWGYQPGVKLHSNGRVASISVSEFGVKGDFPTELGELTELVELYIGTHNDINGNVFERPTMVQGMAISGELNSRRMEVAKNYMEYLHGNQFKKAVSPFMIRAYYEAKQPIPGGLSYNGEDIELLKSGDVYEPTLGLKADTQWGTTGNGVTSLPASIKNLQNLRTLFIANSLITSLPEELSELPNLTDIEVYNCHKMMQFPMVLSRIQNLVALNIARNKQWEEDDILNGLKAMANNPDIQRTLQILFCNENTLEEIPQEFGQLHKIGLLDLGNNKISKVYPMPDIYPVQMNISNNEITSLPADFINSADLESLVADNNKIEVFPNIFNKNDITVSAISFAGNNISSFEGQDDGTFKGMNVKSLNLAGNNFKKYPRALAVSGSAISQMNFAHNGMQEFEDSCFVGENTFTLQSLDLNSNELTDVPFDLNGKNLPFLFGVDLSNNMFSEFPYEVLAPATLTTLIIRSQRDELGNRTLKEWPNNIGSHPALRVFFIGSNDLRTINDNLSFLIFNLDISDNPNIVIDLSSVCYYIQQGVYNLFYDKTQDIRNCPILETE